MSAIPPATLALLSEPRTYPLLESLVRCHIAEGLYTASNLTSATPPPQINSVEGFPLSVSLSKSTPDAGRETQNLSLNGVSLNLTDVPASNGRIHTIGRMLDPYAEYFGRSESSAAPAGGNSRADAKNDTTMAGILASDPRLSVVNKALSDIDPDFLIRLSLSKPANADQIYLAPSNDGFKNIAIESMSAPSNVGLSSYLLRAGMLKGDLGVLNMMVEGSVESVTGFRVPVKKRGEAFLIGNAGVVARDVCANNGCVWIVDRMLDPLFGALG